MPHGDDQGALLGLHDDHPQPFDRRRRRATPTRSPARAWRCSSEPRPASGPCGCSASACTTSWIRPNRANERRSAARSTDLDRDSRFAGRGSRLAGRRFASRSERRRLLAGPRTRRARFRGRRLPRLRRGPCCRQLCAAARPSAARLRFGRRPGLCLPLPATAPAPAAAGTAPLRPGLDRGGAASPSMTGAARHLLDDVCLDDFRLAGDVSTASIPARPSPSGVRPSSESATRGSATLPRVILVARHVRRGAASA